MLDLGPGRQGSEVELPRRIDSTPGLSRRHQEAVSEEARTLAALRDVLLPNLVSGEMRVKDAERFLAKAGV